MDIEITQTFKGLELISSCSAGLVPAGLKISFVFHEKGPDVRLKVRARGAELILWPKGHRHHIDPEHNNADVVQLCSNDCAWIAEHKPLHFTRWDGCGLYVLLVPRKQ